MHRTMSQDYITVPTLTHPDLLMRRIYKGRDTAALLALRSHPEAMRYIGKPLATNAEEVNALIDSVDDIIENHKGTHWGLFLPERDHLIGTMGFFRWDHHHRRAEIGYMLHPDYHRRGLMSLAMHLALRYGWQEMNLHSVEARTYPQNEASQQLLRKHGFVQEGYLRECFCHDGVFSDSVIYSLLRPRD